jgi:phosphoserine phosphatase
MENLNVEQAKSQIPETLMERIKRVEDSFKNRAKDLSNDKIAVFDLDNTLLEGDIGEAVFSQLKINEKKEPLTIDNKSIPFTWEDYQELLRTKGKREAYKQVVISLAGIPLDRFVESTRQVMALKIPFLELGDVKVPVPSPNSLMKALLIYLKNLAYKIYVISASNHYSVKYVAEEFFGIPGANVFGMKPSLFEDRDNGLILGSEIDGPITVGEGKAEAYRQLIGTIPPLIAAGDSTTDFQMLNLIDPQGLCIWVGADDKQYESIKQKLDHPDTAYFLYRENK